MTRLCREHGLSQRHACRLVGIDHSTLRYQARRADDQPIRQRLRELAAVRRRFGYRRLGWLLVREGYRMNHKKMYRLYHEEKLMVRRRGGRKRALGTRAPMLLPERLNQRWSLDFIADTLSDGRRFRILCVVDDFSRECQACVVDTSLSGVRVVRELERLTGERATPQVKSATMAANLLVACNVEIESNICYQSVCLEQRSDCRGPNLRNCGHERARGCCAPVTCAVRG